VNPQVDEFISKLKKWQPEFTALRKILLDCGLEEDFKWKQPCYTFQQSNIVIIGSYKEFCVLSFLKGSLLQDAQGILSKPGENSQSARVIRFTSVAEILKMETLLRAYIQEAIIVEQSGLKVAFKEITDHSIPEELQLKLDDNPVLNAAFKSLTPGRQRAYYLYFSAPKQSKTRESRIEKYTQQIIDGKGINDCTCGLSKKMPYCDGSHKFIK
jgi:uncharacterized protein YdeI (YjbR/CyaY-like superfamily)